MKKVELSKKQKKQLLKAAHQIDPRFADILTHEPLFLIKEPDRLLYLSSNSGKVLAFEWDRHLIPTIHILRQNSDLLPSVWVDKGALTHLINGANVFGPGIVRMDKFQANDVVVVKDISRETILCVGIACVASEAAQKKGKSVTNIHWVGDNLWDFKWKK
ncbi:MAG: PUA domain-containing protein [Candidatus Hodarchaeota archaeon]